MLTNNKSIEHRIKTKEHTGIKRIERKITYERANAKGTADKLKLNEKAHKEIPVKRNR